MKLENFPTNENWTDWDWSHVFEQGECWTATFPSHGIRESMPKMDDVKSVHSWFGDSPEGYGSKTLYALMSLHDGRWLFADCWADTTGWGCQDGMDFHVGVRDFLEQYIITLQQRELMIPLTREQGEL